MQINRSPNGPQLFSALVALVVAVTGCGNAFADTSTGLISFYPFAGNATDTIGGNNGTVSNASLTVDRLGNPNGAYYLNGGSSLSGGGSYIQPAHNFDFIGMGGNLTLSVWVKTSDADGYIFHQANGGQIALRTTGGYASFFTHMANGNWYEATDPTPYAQDTWINITGVYYAHDRNELWVNGDLVDTVSLPATNLFDVTWSDYFYAGLGAYRESWYPDSLQNPFAGSIDEFRVYNRALTQTDIQELSVPEPSTVLMLGIGAVGILTIRRRRSVGLHQ